MEQNWQNVKSKPNLTMLKIENFSITINPIRHFLYECLVVENIEGATKFGIIVNSPTPPTTEGVFKIFLEQPKAFFIDVECITTPQIVGVVEVTPIPSGSSEPVN